ncbi:MAG: LysR family transcriptional regulator [Oscillospiraceae bacterium]|nr:LysR family transcriptional regulator [Oscillospiraceae bacterium]
MEIRDLQYFCLTAELEHVTRAADRLGVAQPFLTKVIRQLEQEIGVPLFDNAGRKIRLNHFGELFYAHAKTILAELDNLRHDMDEAIEHNARTIRIVTNIELHYPEIVMAYQRVVPDYQLAITNAPRDEIAAALVTGAADFGLCSPPLSDDSDKGLITDIVFCERSCAMLPPGDPRLALETIGFGDMVGVPMVTTARDSALRLNLDKLMEKYGYKPQIVCESNDINLLIRAVKSGLGFAVLPRSVMLSIPSIIKYCVESSYDDTFGYVGLSRSAVANCARDASRFAEFVQDFTQGYVDRYYSKSISELRAERDT